MYLYFSETNFVFKLAKVSEETVVFHMNGFIVLPTRRAGISSTFSWSVLFCWWPETSELLHELPWPRKINYNGSFSVINTFFQYFNGCFVFLWCTFFIDSASVVVHVVSGERPAAMQSGAMKLYPHYSTISLLLFAINDCRAYFFIINLQRYLKSLCCLIFKLVFLHNLFPRKCVARWPDAGHVVNE